VTKTRKRPSLTGTPHDAQGDSADPTGHDIDRQAIHATKFSQLLQHLHSVRDRKARLCHHLPTFLRDLRQRLHLAELVRVLAQLAQDIPALQRVARR
jgi:hypothetical protein